MADSRVPDQLVNGVTMRDRSHLNGPSASAAASRNELFGARAERLPDGLASQRNQLFGASRLNPGAGNTNNNNSNNNNNGNSSSSGAAHALEEDNDRRTAELILKVAAVKDAAISIHDEVSEHNRMLTGMGSAFDNTQNLMSGALNRIDGLVRRGGGTNHMCYLILFIVVIFLVLWRFTK